MTSDTTDRSAIPAKGNGKSLPHDASNDLVVDTDQVQSSVVSEVQRGNSVIIKYLLENVEEFRELSKLRQQGWSNPEGDDYFQKQRLNADNSDSKMAQIFFRMMKEIGEDMHRSTGALTIPRSLRPSILDMCMAPGGFLETTMNMNPGARAIAFTLPVAQGGHKVLLPDHFDVTLKYLDITMLAADMGVLIPEKHPEARNMLPQHFKHGQLFDLVICDGQVLRTHRRAEYREPREARRLTVTQLGLGLEHVKRGGTMIVLLHKLEAIDNVSMLHILSKFSTIKLFKPTKYHGKRSSFYMIATDIQSQHSEAKKAIDGWKRMWQVATFGTDDEYKEELREASSNVDKLLYEFKAELVRLGRPIWRTQANALKKAPFMKQ